MSNPIATKTVDPGKVTWISRPTYTTQGRPVSVAVPMSRIPTESPIMAVPASQAVPVVSRLPIEYAVNAVPSGAISPQQGTQVPAQSSTAYQIGQGGSWGVNSGVIPPARTPAPIDATATATVSAEATGIPKWVIIAAVVATAWFFLKRE